jgi:hypothetical protein
MTNRISKAIKNNKEILIVDYSGCREIEMMVLLSVISIYDGTRVTVKYMDCVRKMTPEVLHLVEKQAVVGLDPIKKTILMGYNYLFERNIRAFDTKEEAIDFVVDETTTDRDVPDHLR